MFRGVRRPLLAPLCLLLLAAGVATTAPDDGRALRPVSVATGKHRYYQPSSVPRPSASSTVPGQVRFTWPWVSRATRYRLVWSAKPYGGFLERTVDRPPAGWLPITARASTLRFASAYSSDTGQRAIQTALPYGNPVYARLQANNVHAGSTVKSSPWTRGFFPTIPAPAPGARLRVGTWNMDGYAQKDPDGKPAAMAAAIRLFALDVVAVQETAGTYVQQIQDRLGGWESMVGLPTAEQQVIWNPATYSRGEQRLVDVPNYKENRRLVVPCQRLVPRDGSRPFWVASPHFVVNTTYSQTTRNAETSRDAEALTDALATFAGSDPVVIAGDLTANREPYTVPSSSNPGGAQQTLVQRGYWDSRAALRRYGVGYSTLNRGTYPQPASPVGVGSRADYILTKGIHGAGIYYNYANQQHPHSDHNLVWSELHVPPAG